MLTKDNVTIGIEWRFEVGGTRLQGKVPRSASRETRSLLLVTVSFGQLIVNSKPLILGLLLRFAPTIM